MKEDAPYSRQEVAQYTDKPPASGLLWPKCGTRIPQFLDLPDSDRFGIKKLISHQQRMLAIAELRAATGCSLEWPNSGSTIRAGRNGMPVQQPHALTVENFFEQLSLNNAGIAAVTGMIRIVRLGSQPPLGD